MSEPDSQEFRSYRQALTVLYVSTLALGSILVMASIVVELFFGRADPSPRPTPADLLQCNHDTRTLLEDLGKMSSLLQADAVVGNVRELGTRWDDFARGWRKRWDEVARSCQYDTLADTGLGAAYDMMAQVHRQLPALQLEYREMMKRFSDDQAIEIEDMRSALDKSRKALEESSETPPPVDAG